MKDKKFHIIFFCLFLIFQLPTLADDIKDRWGFGLKLNGRNFYLQDEFSGVYFLLTNVLTPYDLNLRNDPPSSDLKADLRNQIDITPSTAPILSLMGKFGLTSDLAARIELEYYTNQPFHVSVFSDNGGYFFNNLTTYLFNLHFDFLYNIIPENDLVPYIGAGVGTSFLWEEIRLSDQHPPRNAAYYRFPVLLNAIAGLEWFMSPDFSLDSNLKVGFGEQLPKMVRAWDKELKRWVILPQVYLEKDFLSKVFSPQEADRRLGEYGQIIELDEASTLSLSIGIGFNYYF